MHTKGRTAALQNGADPSEYLVPGCRAFLANLTERGYRLYLASGTDEADVLREAKLLGVDAWFGGQIHGARDNMTDCSKELVIQDILRENHLTGRELLSFGDGFVEIELGPASAGMPWGWPRTSAGAKGSTRTNAPGCWRPGRR